MPGDGGAAGTPPASAPAARERILAFAGALLVALYLLDKESGALVLAETRGGAAGRYGLPERYRVTGRSPAAEAVVTGRPLWLDAAGFAARRDKFPGTVRPPAGTAGASLGALPLRAGTDAPPRGCLVLVGDAVDGFAPEQRRFLQRYADEIAAGLPAAVAAGGEWPLLGPALRRLRTGGFSLVPSTGLIDADASLLDLFGIQRDEFDGKVESLLAPVVPDDLPGLEDVVDASATVAGCREVEFRVRLRTGEFRRLRLGCRALRDGGGRPEQLLGVVADASGPGSDDEGALRRLSDELDRAQTARDVGRIVVAALRGPLCADRLALGALEADRLVVTVLDPPRTAAWPDSWRAEWRSEWPDPPVRAIPELQAALRSGTARFWPAGAALEPALADVGPGGLAVLPLPAHGRIAGVCLIGWEQPHESGPQERSMLTTAAGLIGEALMRGLAYDAEQELAGMLQRTLLPRRLPALPGGEAVARYRPATHGLQVGGDWYDVIALSENHVVLVIGDVQGHSTAAATVMGQMRTAVRAYAVEGHPPDVTVSHANRLLIGMETDLFATCTYVDLDMEEGDALIVRAGHLPPLLRLPDGSTEEVTADGGPPLGVLADTDFPMTAVTLAPGTVIGLLTDGLVESASLRVEDGLRRVRDAFAAADPADIGQMADDVIGQRGPPADDVALLLLRYDGMKVRPVRARSVVWRLPDAVMHARRFTARTLRAWHLTDVSDAALLVISELVTNALIHTHGAVGIDLTLAGDRLRIAVSDSSARAPAKPVAVDWESTGGRGILLVEAVSGAWGSVPVSGGKQVWSEIVLPPREQEPEPEPPGGLPQESPHESQQESPEAPRGPGREPVAGGRQEETSE
ncbi:SpoIIE family protein phosphatase [Actinacidiphila acididurans]|uniref:SpoIIE family protein phosphatase n=1 Tax=Actinacidiphila acididurans TaxID=2784346 RepID=A0ABS2TJ65_9ACTN|nr:SpoIIE family protein phosphatase [Actinacidiphila acididurans]MBM9503388.1 SpoIIE family protein phosphatase [Actinacidiphila acididurans]